MRSLLTLAAVVATTSTLFAQSPPRIAVMETALGKVGDAASFELAEKAGYTAMQMHSGNLNKKKKNKRIPLSAGLPIGSDPKVLTSWKTASRKHGVEIISLCAGSLNKCRIWDRDREVAMRIAKQTVDGCHELGINVMLFPFFGPSNFQESDEAFNGIADFMTELLPYGEAKNVVIGIEAPVTTVRVLALMEKLDYPSHLKIYYDTGNLFAKEDIYATIAQHAKKHFCEIHIKASNHAVAGQGDIDLKRLAAALDEGEYEGWLVYEANRSGKDPVSNQKVLEKLVSLRQR